jgi:hypothetical protein
LMRYGKTRPISRGWEFSLNRSHIPEVDGSIPLPPTNNNKGLQVVFCTPFSFGVIMVSWFLEGGLGEIKGGFTDAVPAS